MRRISFIVRSTYRSIPRNPQLLIRRFPVCVPLCDVNRCNAAWVCHEVLNLAGAPDGEQPPLACVLGLGLATPECAVYPHGIDDR
jgi:hypothetical protein